LTEYGSDQEGIHNLQPRHRGCIVTIGNFDGVHLGHQAILRQVKQKSLELGAPSMLICFEPQPKEFFDAFSAPARLTRFREKVVLLAEQGIDLVLCLKFDEKTRSMSAPAFIDLLVKDLQVRAVFAGDEMLASGMTVAVISICCWLLVKNMTLR